jgi:outer membrane protein assembly factor BamB
MSTIPTSAFADRVQTLDHEEFQAFVADLWSLAGWETAIDDGIVVARRGDRIQRLLVLPTSRLARFRSDPPPADQFDRVVSPQADDADTTSLDGTGKPLVDAGDLRHRLIYGSENAAAAQFWDAYFDDDLRHPEWDQSGQGWTWSQVALAGASLLLVVSAVVVLVLGFPFLGGDSPTETTVSTLDDGLNAEIDLGPAERRIDEPSAIAWGETVYVGSDVGTFAALDADTGEIAWSREFDGLLRSPLVSNGTVYVRSPGRIHALDAVTGESQWTYSNVTVEWTHYAFAYSSSTRLSSVNGTLYFTDDTELVALDGTTGDVRWNVSLPGTVAGTPTVINGTVYLGSTNGTVSAYDAATGQTRWTRGYDEETFHVSGTPNVDQPDSNESLLISGLAGLYEFDAHTGAQGELFNSSVYGKMSPPVVFNGSSSLGVETTNGTASEPALFVADERAYLYALDPATGERDWTYQQQGARLQQPIAGAPVGNESAASIYFVKDSPIVGAKSVITALNASSGTQRWHFDSENQSIKAVTSFEDTLYTGTGMGEVVALGAENGTEQWRTDAFEEGISGAVTVVTDPLGGDSVDSRIRLGVGGHHDWLDSRETAGAERTGGISVIQTSMSETVASGENVEVRVSLTNLGNSRNNTTVTVDSGWETETGGLLETVVELDPDEARELTFTFAAPQEPGNYSSEIRVGNESTDYATAVTERPSHEVTGLDDPDAVWQEDGAEIIASVRNAGNVTATTPIALEFNGEIVESTQRTIGPNETVSVTFTLSPADAPAGEYNYSVATNDDIRTGSLDVLTVDRREDALPIVTQVFGFTLLVSGLAIGWRVVTDIHGSLIGRDGSAGDE